MGKKVILNAVVIRPGLGLRCYAATLEEVKAAVAEGASSYVGHPTTAQLLGVPCTRAEYVPCAGDVAYVVRLKRRQQQPGDVEVGVEDLEFLHLEYFELT